MAESGGERGEIESTESVRAEKGNWRGLIAVAFEQNVSFGVCLFYFTWIRNLVLARRECARRRRHLVADRINYAWLFAEIIVEVLAAVAGQPTHFPPILLLVRRNGSKMSYQLIGIIRIDIFQRRCGQFRRKSSLQSNRNRRALLESRIRLWTVLFVVVIVADLLAERRTGGVCGVNGVWKDKRIEISDILDDWFSVSVYRKALFLIIDYGSSKSVFDSAFGLNVEILRVVWLTKYITQMYIFISN